MDLLIIALVVTAMLAGNALYVAAEFAAVSSSKPKLRAHAEDGRSEADYVDGTVNDSAAMDRYIACAQVGITLTSLVIGFYGQRALSPYFLPLLEPSVGSGVAASLAATLVLIALTVLQVIFGELFPKSVALRSPEDVAILTARPMRWSLALLRPFIRLLNGSALTIMARLGLHKPKEDDDSHSHDELRQLIAASMEGGALETSAHEMLHQVLSFQDRSVRQVMIPRIDMAVLSADLPAEEALARAASTPHTRFPLIETGEVDRPTGFVHIREIHDLAGRDARAPVSTVAREMQVLPDSLTLEEVWTTLHRRHDVLAVLFDEYGDIAGLVTVEDLVEEIIGEVVDEFDEEEPLIRKEKDRLVLRGDLPVSEVNRRFLLDLPEDRAESVSALVAVALGVDGVTQGAVAEIAEQRLTVEAVDNGVPSLIAMPRDNRRQRPGDSR